MKESRMYSDWGKKQNFPISYDFTHIVNSVLVETRQLCNTKQTNPLQDQVPIWPAFIYIIGLCNVKWIGVFE